MAVQTPSTPVTLDSYLAARDLAISLNAKLVQNRKELAACGRRVDRLEQEASDAEDAARNLKAELDAKSPPVTPAQAKKA